MSRLPQARARVEQENESMPFLGHLEELRWRLVKAVIAISAPCDLNGSCDELLSLKNKAYAIRFLDHLKQKLNTKLLN